MAVVERQRSQGVEVLTLNRPERLNAINREVLCLLEDYVTGVAKDNDIHCVVVTGAGEQAFSAGADVGELSDLDPLQALELMATGQRAYATLEECPKPVLAAINGYALGGGLELALACDLRLAGTNAKLGQPEITLANVPGWGGTQRLPRIVGEGVAKDLVLTGRVVGPSEALALRLVNRTTEGPVLEAALALADGLSHYSPTALALAKQAIHAGRAPGHHGYVVERQAVALCCTTTEQREAVRRFLSKGARPTPKKAEVPTTLTSSRKEQH
jgi:enoyl-CoA hydratase